MGVLTDFVIALPSEAPTIGKSLNPSQEFDGIDAKGIDQIKLGTLYAILNQKPYNSQFMTTEDSFLFTASDDGSWVQLVPDDLVKQVANLDSSEIIRVSDLWSRTEEFDHKYSGWSKTDVEAFLTDFVNLCKKAGEAQKSVLMWVCL